MAGEKAGSRKKDAYIGYRTTKKKRRLIKKKLRKESAKLDYDISVSELLGSLVNRWLRNRGVPDEVVASAEKSVYHRMKDGLLEDFNEWWYVHGHFEKNIKKMKEVWGTLSPEGKRQGRELLKRYEELQELADDIFLVEDE